MHILGIDIGGTKVAVAVGTETGEILCDQRIPMNPSPPDAVLSEITAIARRLMVEIGCSIDAVGISAPGPMCSTRQMILEAPNLKGWEGYRVGEYFSAVLGLPVFMQNDANGAGLAEYMFGGQKGKDLIYVTMSTGIGAGIVANGKLVAGVNDLGGEVGHFTLVPDGRPCACGRKGCWEAYCGGKALANHVRQDILKNQVQTQILDLANGDVDQISMKEICDAVRRGDAYANEQWDEFIDRMAHAVGILIQTMNPEAITMGTIAIHEGDIFIPQMRERLADYAWSCSADSCVIEASHLKNIGELSAIAVGIHGLSAEQCQPVLV
jgi:glucokinase